MNASPPRRASFQRNLALEALLAELSALLGPVEAQLVAHFERPTRPVILIVGAPRSGTTLLLQWLAQSGYLAYPTNLLSRFYAAPALGARIQLLLTDPRYDFRQELGDLQHTFDLTSELGKTRGALAPNEFWYFWRRFFPLTAPRQLSPAEEVQADGPGFAAEIAALQAVFEQPFVAKGMLLQFNLPFLARFFDHLLFIHIQRHPLYVMQSLLAARETYFGDREAWYSVEPPEAVWLRAQPDPIQQVAGQVYYTRQHITAGLARLPAAQALVWDYEALCDRPAAHWEALTTRLAQHGYRPAADWLYRGPERLTSTNRPQLTPAEQAQARAAYAHFSGEVWRW